MGRFNIVYPSTLDLLEYYPNIGSKTAFINLIFWIIQDLTLETPQAVDKQDIVDILDWDYPDLMPNQIDMLARCVQHAVLLFWHRYRPWFIEIGRIHRDSIIKLNEVNRHATIFSVTPICPGNYRHASRNGV